MRFALTLLPLLFVSSSLAVKAFPHNLTTYSAPVGAVNEKSDAVYGPQPLYSQDAQWTLGDEYVGVQDIVVGPQHISVGARFVLQTIDVAANGWLRVGFDRKLNYITVDGQEPPFNADHFIELQHVRDALTTYPGWETNVNLNDLFIIMEFVNQPNNIFEINGELNNRKSKIALSEYVTNDVMKLNYLCVGFTPVDPTTPRVWQRVEVFLFHMSNHPNAVLQHIGHEITAIIGLGNLRC